MKSNTPGSNPHSMKFNERGQEILHNLKLAQQKDIAVQTLRRPSRELYVFIDVNYTEGL